MSEDFLKRMHELLDECAAQGTKHMLTIVVDDATGTLSMYTIGATEEYVFPMLRSAMNVVEAGAEETGPRSIN